MPQNPSSSAGRKEAAFFLRHPDIATRIGEVTPGSTNISTNSTRISARIGLEETPTREGSQVNAFRHVIWQATIAVNFGSQIATEVGYAHEESVPDRIRGGTFRGSDASAQADTIADLLNNRIGQNIASANPNASPQALAMAALDDFHQSGFITSRQNPDGSFSTTITRITDEQYNQAKDVLSGLNNNGFTAAEQKQHDDAAESRRKAEIERRWDRHEEE